MASGMPSRWRRDRGERRDVVSRECRIGVPGASDEQLRCGTVDGERRHNEGALAGNRQWFTTRRQHPQPPAAPQRLDDEVRHRSEDMFTVVQHEHELTITDRCQHSFADGLGSGRDKSERGHDHRIHGVGFMRSGQLDDPHPAADFVAYRLADGHRKACLADSALPR